MSKRNHEKTVADSITENISDALPSRATEELNEVFGIVSDCLRLNIRTAPSKDSTVKTVASFLDELKIDYANSTDEWYAVCTASGIDGFCMKNFINIEH